MDDERFRATADNIAGAIGLVVLAVIAGAFLVAIVRAVIG